MNKKHKLPHFIICEFGVYMTRLGSHKNPAILRVQSQEKAQEILTICDENNWQVIIDIAPDKPEITSDLDKLLHPSMPVQYEQPKVGRNDACFCGSGKKYKKCCLNHEHEHHHHHDGTCC